MKYTHTESPLSEEGIGSGSGVCLSVVYVRFRALSSVCAACCLSDVGNSLKPRSAVYYVCFCLDVLSQLVKLNTCH